MEIQFYNSKINKKRTINIHEIDEVVYQIRDNQIVVLKILGVYISHCTNIHNSTGISTHIEYQVESETFGKERIDADTVFSSIDDLIYEMKSKIVK